MSSVSGRSAKSGFKKSRSGRRKARSLPPSRFERAVDPDGLLQPEERKHRAALLRHQVQFTRLARRYEQGVA
ncbi:hypothetical protein K7711_31875 [Nocardia sp. CA2R105]|uniref:hypothetical protein n=1 Tax=Nocardia coffeae TaxID=2873381 RepID=UPI001CA69A5F|nr:hypothetical protein [Nocardia coffeae]MBY8861113.1 hypothetical protein [Nocardia coffeae]